MAATSLDLSQIKTDALSSASTFRTLIGLGSTDTPTFKNLTATGGTVTTSTPLVDATQTWNDGAVTFTGLKLNVTDTASSSSSLLMDLQVGGSSRIAINKNSSITVSRSGNAAVITDTQRSHCVGFPDGNLALGTSSTFAAGIVIRDFGCTVASSRGFHWNSGNGLIGGALHCSIMSDGANIVAQRNLTNAQTFRIYNTFTNASNYERGKLEWSSNVFRIGTEKAGTGSARALELQTDGTTRLTIGAAGLFTIADALNIEVGTTTGTKIGTATTQKIGFFNATPVVQPTAVADATDAASVITQLNALLSRIRDLGLIAT